MNHSFSKEILFHFSCGGCKKWWSIGDHQFTSNNTILRCPHCGYRAASNEIIKPTLFEESVINDYFWSQKMTNDSKGAKIEFIGEGWHNKIFIINDNFIVRFGKNDKVHAKTILYQRLYDRLLNKFVSIPNIEEYKVLSSNDQNYKCVSLYRSMKGKHPEFNVDFPAYSMARFLEHMRDIQYHDVLIDEPDLMTEVYQESISVYDSLANKVDLETTEIEFVRELYEKYLNTFDGISIPFCLIHSDMTEKNLIVDDDNKLSIIDWDGLQIDDPVYEMGVFPYLIFREILRHYDRELGERVEERYWFHRLRREILGVHYCTSPTYADKLEFHIAKFRNRVREYRLFNNT